MRSFNENISNEDLRDPVRAKIRLYEVFGLGVQESMKVQ